MNTPAVMINIHLMKKETQNALDQLKIIKE